MPVELTDDEARALRRKAQAAALAAIQSLGGEGHRPAIMERALEIGGFSEAELAAPGPPTKLAQYPRRVDYELSWALTNLKRKGRVINPRWSVWALALADAEPALAAPAAHSRVEQLRAMSYREYLRTPEWRETRLAALVRGGHACALDVSHGEHLEVHHRTYERLGEELPGDVIVLCRDCHRRHHGATGRPRRDHRPPRSFPPPAVSGVVTESTARDAAVPTKRSLLSRLLSR